ncbi:hypothetical protein METHP14_10090 [Pseudomonas sp. P14-2025]
MRAVNAINTYEPWCLRTLLPDVDEFMQRYSNRVIDRKLSERAACITEEAPEAVVRIGEPGLGRAGCRYLATRPG